MDGERILGVPVDAIQRPAANSEAEETRACASGETMPHDGWRQIIPVPDGVPLPTYTLTGRDHGPVNVTCGPSYVSRENDGAPCPPYVYRDAAGRVLGCIVRFSYGDGRKEFRPYIYGEWPDGRRDWRAKGFPAPRSIYGLDRLALHRDAPVLVVEGEKAADAAQALFPSYAVVTSPHGAKSADKADWSSLAGRVVVIWPDHDDEGRRYAADVARLAVAAAAASVSIVSVPAEFPPKWDLADEAPNGWPLARLKELAEAALRAARPFDHVDGSESVELPFRLTATVVEYREEREEGDPRWVYVCSRFEILAATRDDGGKEWGRLVRITDADGNVHEWAMPMTILAGDGQAYRERLLSMGLRLGAGAKARARLHEYIISCKPQRRARCVSRVGWHGGCYVMPDGTLGHSDEVLILQSEGAPENAMRQSGTLAEWQRDIGRLCAGNSRLVFAVSASFGAALLRRLDGEGGGFHFRGASSVGKTTALRVAGSVWGGGGSQGYMRTWRGTGNGIEAVAQTHSDGLLCLDEIGEVDGREVGQIAYMLANGEGKSRARKDGSGRPPARWRVLFLSTGEQSLADKMAEAGRPAHAGQEVRFIDIAADAGAGAGLFETLHEFPSADTLARHLCAAVTRSYGTPIRAFLERLLASQEDFTALLKHEVRRFVESVLPPGADGQVQRVAQRFGMVAAAGWLAARLGVVPWPEGDAFAAARVCFGAWLEGRGGAGSAEDMRALRSVRLFFEKHGESRFTPWDHVEADRPTMQRAGFRRAGEGRSAFFVFPEVFKKEVCAGADWRHVARVLRDRGILLPDPEGRSTRGQRLPGYAKSARVFVIDGDALFAAEI